MDRLTINDNKIGHALLGEEGIYNCFSYDSSQQEALDLLDEVIKRLTEYEDLEEQVIEKSGVGLTMLYQKYSEFVDEIAEFLEYKRLEEQGMLLRFPCKIGTEVFYINKSRKEIIPIRILSYKVNTYGICEVWLSLGSYTPVIVFLKDFGKTVFLTKEEAEDALKKMEEKDEL